MGVAEDKIFQNKINVQCDKPLSEEHKLHRESVPAAKTGLKCLMLPSVWNKVFAKQLNGFPESQLFWGVLFLWPGLLFLFNL